MHHCSLGLVSLNLSQTALLRDIYANIYSDITFDTPSEIYPDAMTHVCFTLLHPASPCFTLLQCLDQFLSWDLLRPGWIGWLRAISTEVTDPACQGMSWGPCSPEPMKHPHERLTAKGCKCSNGWSVKVGEASWWQWWQWWQYKTHPEESSKRWLGLI